MKIQIQVSNDKTYKIKYSVDITKITKVDKIRNTK